MTREWVVRCKDCGKLFGYSDWSYLQGVARGYARPERCPECHKHHNRQTAAIGMSYFELDRRASSDTVTIDVGAMGAPSHLKREYKAVERLSPFDYSKYGIGDDVVRKLFKCLSDPNHQVAIVVGPVGSGKSTVLPYRLINPPEGVTEDQFTRNGQIVVTQPRIQAIRNISAYVAKELHGASLGSGYDLGFRYSNHPYSDWRTRLVYVTDGTLLNWIVNGQIANLSTIMIDEAHERSMNIDLILGLLKKVLPRYPHLKLIIASATIDSAMFLDYFGPERACFIEFQGMRKFRVSVNFCSEDAQSEHLPYHNVALLRERVADEIARKVFWLLQRMTAGEKEPGDVLGFLQGEHPIEQAVATLRKLIKSDEKLTGTVDVFPLYTTLPQEEQDKALKPKPDPSRRRVVIATNVAETSLTVEDVVYIVDSGLINEAQWDPESQTKRISTLLHSQVGCRQRWGRAGRFRDGEAYCLYTEKQFSMFPKYTVPAIQRSALDYIILTAKAAGIDDLYSFEWVQRPPLAEIDRALRVLKKIGALDEQGDLTEHGLKLQAFAKEPTIANLMIIADRFACAVEMATILPMMMMGGPRHFLRWDRKWDATVRRAVDRIHRALMKGCLDDIEFCLKLYKAWSETEYYGQLIAPDWAVREVWPRYVPSFPSKMKEILGTEGAKQFREAAAASPGEDSLHELVRQFGLEEVADDWLTDAESALLRARQEAWAKAFFVNHSIFKNKLEPERELLLDALFGHKKEEERRPINLDLLDRVRIIFAYCLPEQRFEGFHSDGEHTYAGESDSGGSFIYQQHCQQQSNEDTIPLVRVPVRIHQDSVCHGRDVRAFVAGKLQVMTQHLSLEALPAKIMYVSYLSLIEPRWLKWLERSGHSQAALGQFISAQTRNAATGELLSTYAYERLFLDQIVPIGSRHQCQVMDIHADGTVQLGFVRRLSDARKVQEDFRGDEPTIIEVEETETVDEMDIGAADLVDTMLNLEEAVPNIEEDEIPPWLDLIDDRWEVEVRTSPINPLPPDSENITAPTAKASLRERYDRMSQSHLLYSGETDRLQDGIISDWPDRPIGYLHSTNNNYQKGDTLAVEVIDYDFDDLILPRVIVQPVPDPEPFDVFVRQYRNRIGDTITVIATAYGERPGDALVSLVVREPVSGLEILLEPDQLSFTIRGPLLKEIPLGSELQAVIEHIDEDLGRVYLSCLPLMEAHLNEKLRQLKSRDWRYEVEAVVGYITLERVFLILDWSEPARGLLHIASVGGRGLYKPLKAYRVGETCRVRLWFPDRPSRKGLDELPEEIKAIIDVQRIFQNLSWESGILQFSGRMSYSLRNELQAPTRDKNYRRAIETLYRFSNQFIAETVDTEWRQRIGNKYPIGTHVSEAKVLSLANFGAFVELEPGVSGLVHRSEMTLNVDESPEDIFTVGDLVEVRVISIDSERQTIALSMKMPGKEPALKYHVGDLVRGRVTSVQNYGAFVELERGVNGLVHKSEMKGNVFDARDVISVGAQVDVLILSMENGKLSLSMKKVSENNPLLKYHAGDRARGRVTEVRDYGAFVELEPGVSGLVHKSKMGGYVPDLRLVVKVGEEVNVVVLSVDTQRQNLSLSMLNSNVESPVETTYAWKCWQTLKEFVSSQRRPLPGELLEDVVDLLALSLLNDSSTKVPLLNHDSFFWTLLNVRPIFDNIRMPQQLPIILYIGSQFSENDATDLLHLMNKIAPEGRLAIVLFFMSPENCRIAALFLENYIRRLYAYTIIPMAYDEFSQIVEGKDARRLFRRLVLTKSDLSRISPFHTHGPTPDNIFFGREHELLEISDRVDRASYALVGGRRIGKSSILNQLWRVRLPAQFHPLRYQCQRLSSSAPTYKQFLEAVTFEWLPHLHGYTPTSFRDVIAQLPDDKSLVFLIDEVDRIILADRLASWPLFRELRALSESWCCQFVFAGERLLREEIKDGRSPLFNFVKTMPIRCLDRPTVEELVTSPMRQIEVDLIDEAAIVQQIWDATGGHPSVVQCLCQRLIQRLNERRDRQLSPDDVLAVANDLAFLKDDFYDVYLEQATVLERMLFLMLAQETNQSFPLGEIYHRLEERFHLAATRRGKPRASEVEAALQRLVDLRSILRYTRDGYVFAGNAFRQLIDSWGETTVKDELLTLTENYEEYGDPTEDEIAQWEKRR